LILVSLLQTLIPCIPQHRPRHQTLNPVPVAPILTPGCLDKDFIKSLSPDTPTPHGSLDILNERISILGEVVRGIYHQLLLSSLLSEGHTFVEWIIGIAVHQYSTTAGRGDIRF
jgi:hypothetical protein